MIYHGSGHGVSKRYLDLRTVCTRVATPVTIAGAAKEGAPIRPDRVRRATTTVYTPAASISFRISYLN